MLPVTDVPNNNDCGAITYNVALYKNLMVLVAKDLSENMAWECCQNIEIVGNSVNRQQRSLPHPRSYTLHTKNRGCGRDSLLTVWKVGTTLIISLYKCTLTSTKACFQLSKKSNLGITEEIVKI